MLIYCFIIKKCSFTCTCVFFVVPLQRQLCAYMKEIIEYIIAFLLYGNKEASKQVGYTADESQWKDYRVVIVPNGHLGGEIVMPELSEVKGERLEAKGTEHQTWIIRTDIVYNTFFFI